MIGNITMRGVTKELRLPVTLSKPIKDPWGNNDLLESGIPAVGDEIEIDINAEAIKDAQVKSPPTN